LNKQIVIIDNSNISYTGEDINGTILRGTETSLILLAENFAKKKIKVDFCTQTNHDKFINNVKYFNIQKINKKINYDLAIVVSDANFFDYIQAGKKALFSVSNQPFEKFIRKKQLIPFIKHKPTVITLCDYQFKKRSFITSFYGKKTIPITVDPIFIDTSIDLTHIPKKRVTYNIRSNRNLDRLIKIWIEKIYPFDKKAELFITPGLIQYSDELKEKNIHLRKMGTRSEMIEEMKSYRALTYLGHKSDIFTLTAEEAVRLCLPVISFGIGSLIDRVQHNENGFIARNDEEFAKYTINILNDDELYLNLKNKMFKNRLDNSWEKITKEWIKFFFNE
jgi:glycosyltransferase involved in cell wall biosynthesis